MNNCLNEVDGRHSVAIIEVADHLAPTDILPRSDLETFTLQPASLSPDGYRWFHVVVSSRLTPQCAAALTASLLSKLADQAAAGQIEGFRVVVGNHWLKIDAGVAEGDCHELGLKRSEALDPREGTRLLSSLG